MTSSGQVFDLGYQPYDGDRLGRPATRSAIMRDGLRRVAGLRRKARRKILPWSLAAIAILPAVVFLALSVIIGEALDTEDFFGPVQYFSFNAFFTLIFVAFASAELMVPDRIYGTLQVYASRPLSTVDYLVARSGALVAVVLGFLFIPQLLLWLGEAAVSSDGFLSYLVDHLDVLWKAALASLVYMAASAPIALLVAALAAKASYSAGIFLGGIFIANGLSAGLVDADFPVFGLLSVGDHPGYVTDWIFDTSSETWIPERAGFDAWVSLAVIAVVAVACGFLLLRRYRRLM
jgi:ABC-2 type transport system permease protein